MRNPGTKAWRFQRSAEGLRNVPGDPIWVVSVLASLVLNLAAFYGYAQTLANGSWNKPLVCPTECKEPLPVVALTLEEAQKALPPPPPEVKAEVAPMRAAAPPSSTPSPPAAMSPIVIPPLKETPATPATIVPVPEVLRPIYVQEPAQETSPAPEGAIMMEAPPIAAPLPPGYVPWAQSIDQAPRIAIAAALANPGGVHVERGASGSGLGKQR